MTKRMVRFAATFALASLLFGCSTGGTDTDQPAPDSAPAVSQGGQEPACLLYTSRCV